MLLCNAGFLTAFLGPTLQPPPTVILDLFWWLLFVPVLSLFTGDSWPLVVVAVTADGMVVTQLCVVVTGSFA